VDLDQDDKVTNDSYEAARDRLQRLESDDDRKPKEILVDVSGSVRSMQTSVLLACLRPDQDAHLIGVDYKPDGSRGDSFLPHADSLRARSRPPVVVERRRDEPFLVGK
jgi:hypothetical protein